MFLVTFYLYRFGWEAIAIGILIGNSQTGSPGERFERFHPPQKSKYPLRMAFGGVKRGLSASLGTRGPSGFGALQAFLAEVRRERAIGIRAKEGRQRSQGLGTRGHAKRRLVVGLAGTSWSVPSRPLVKVGEFHLTHESCLFRRGSEENPVV